MPSTVWGTASSETAKFNVGAVLAPRYRQAFTPPSGAPHLDPVRRYAEPAHPGDALPSPDSRPPPRAGCTRIQAAIDTAKGEVCQSNQCMRLAATESCFQRRVVAREAEQGFAQQPTHAVGRVGTLAENMLASV